MNITLVGILTGVASLLIIILPLAKVLRKKFCAKDHHILPDWAIDKITSILMIIFLMMAQEMMIILFLSWKYSLNKVGAIALGVIYLLFFIYFFMSTIFKPFNFFRSKPAQAVSILRKFTQPIFILFEPNLHFVIFIFFIFFDIIELGLTHKKKELNSFNRQLAYRIIEIIATILLVVNYIIEINVDLASASNIVGIISAVGLSLFIYPICLEIIILVRIMIGSRSD